MDWAVIGGIFAGVGSFGGLIFGVTRSWSNKIEAVKTLHQNKLDEQRKDLEIKIEKVRDDCVKRDEYKAMTENVMTTLGDLKRQIDRIVEFLMDRPSK